MSLSLTIGKNTDIATIADFFDRAGPEARIRARTSGNSTELYVRDMSVSGRLIEWLLTREDERKSAYDAARSLITDCVKNEAGTNTEKSQALNQILNALGAHQHDFRTEEIGKSIDQLSNDIRQPRARDAVELGFQSIGVDESVWLRHLTDKLSDPGVDQLADEICQLLKKPGHTESIRAGLDSLRAYLQAKTGNTTTDSIDFVSIRQFQTALVGAMNIYSFRTTHNIATNCPTIAGFLSMQILRSACMEASQLSAPSNYVFAAPDAPSDAVVANPFFNAPEANIAKTREHFDTLKKQGMKLSMEELPGSILAKPRKAFWMLPKEENFSPAELETGFRKIADELQLAFKKNESYSVRIATFAPKLGSKIPLKDQVELGAMTFADVFSELMNRHPQNLFQVVLPPTMSQQEFIDTLEKYARTRRESRRERIQATNASTAQT